MNEQAGPAPQPQKEAQPDGPLTVAQGAHIRPVTCTTGTQEIRVVRATDCSNSLGQQQETEEKVRSAGTDRKVPHLTPGVCAGAGVDVSWGRDTEEGVVSRAGALSERPSALSSRPRTRSGHDPGSERPQARTREQHPGST